MQFLKINLTEIIINYKNFTNFWGFKIFFKTNVKQIDKILQNNFFIKDDQNIFCKTMRIVNEIY